MKTAKPENPQDWLPVGQHVRLPVKGMYSPIIYNPDMPDAAERLYDGQIVEHLANGGVVVAFPGLLTIDYTAREARRFSRTY